MKKSHWIGWIFMLGLIVSSSASAMSRSENRSLVVILMGPPGSGKGTHAGPLSQQLGLPHISTGDIFRLNIRSETPLGKQAKKFIDEGHLVPDELVINMLFDRVRAADCKNGYILDGFPRTMAQAKILDQRLKPNSQVVVLNFNLSDAAIIERITGRIACKSCGKPYHKTFDPPQDEWACDVCAGPLFQRDDDKEEIIQKRLQVYQEQTQPLISYYAQQKDVLREIDSAKEKAQVYQNVIDALPLREASSCSLTIL